MIDCSYMGKKVQIQNNDGHIIYGTFNYKNTKAKKIIIFVHEPNGSQARHLFFNSSRFFSKKGFSLLEILIVIGIIALLATIAFANLIFARDKARDTKRIADISQIGKFITLGCYLPDGGVTSIDLIDLGAEIIAENPQYAKFLSNIPLDPLSGSDSVSNYTYIVTADGSSCALYANIEQEGAKVTLPSLTEPTPGGGQGILQGSSVGPNGTDLYYQYSN